MVMDTLINSGENVIIVSQPLMSDIRFIAICTVLLFSVMCLAYYFGYKQAKGKAEDNE